jgi:hypothetical protein
VLARFQRYGVFVSYKSQDARLAREIADQLIASGIRVWFAEYQILLQNRAQFQDAILRGIRRSHYGLAITNRRYVESEYCRLELTQLLDLCGAGKTWEVKTAPDVQPHQVFPQLRESCQVTAESAPAVLPVISSQTGWAIEGAAPIGQGPGRRRIEGTCMGRRYELDIWGWDVLETGGEQVGNSTQGPVLRSTEDRLPILVNVYAGPDPAPGASRQDQSGDDREMYNALLDYLPRHMGRLNAKVVGVHLLFHQGLSQMAVTYRMPRRYGGYWTRKTSVIVPHPETGQGAEFVFTFGFSGPFREYCRRAAAMDRLATTLEWA